jgi:hypothetical protein
MRIYQARTRIPCAIPQGIATKVSLFRLPQKRRLVRTHSCGVWTSSITVITGKLTRLGKGSGRSPIDSPLRMLFTSLILLSAAGVKIREPKNAAAARHAMRAAAMLRQLIKVEESAFERTLGMSPATLAEHAEAATRIPAELRATAPS